MKILEYKRSFPGASRETWLIQAQVAGRTEGLALRADPARGRPGAPLTLRQEFEVYRRLYGTDVPVAEPLWYAQDVEFLAGRPHMVRRMVDGTTAIAGLTAATAAGAQLRKTVAFEVVEKLACLHKLDWQALGFGELLGAPQSPALALRYELEAWIRRWSEACPYPDPVIEEAICWLSENVPTDTPRISLLKGNNGVGEEIWRDGRIVGMSDWELASLGDGAGDLQFSSGTLQLTSVDEVVAHYGRCVGQPVSPERLAFSAFLVWFKQWVCMRCYMYRSFMEQDDPRITSLSFGLLYTMEARKRLAACIGKNIVDAWRALMTDERAIYSSLEDRPA
ncbi:MAG TPA: phosphotransferase family protein [Steroidobacteraceae bacterium]|nr:phosphotransferase family protein [Steroidobacteraceae bacterium]